MWCGHLIKCVDCILWGIESLIRVCSLDMHILDGNPHGVAKVRQMMAEKGKKQRLCVVGEVYSYVLEIGCLVLCFKLPFGGR